MSFQGHSRNLARHRAGDLGNLHDGGRRLRDGGPAQLVRGFLQNLCASPGLDDLGIADKTIVVFTSDKGAEVMTCPDGGPTPFRGEKATNWEGGYRVPTVIRWPGTIQPGTIYNDMFSHHDLIPTFAAAGGDPDIVDRCLRGSQIGDKTFKVHLDGFNLMLFFRGEVKEAPRKEFLYWNDDGELVAIRVNEWKVVFKEQEHTG
jgi:arylsulfatase A-like enzyme